VSDPVDQVAREEAIRTFDRNVVVLASAGTGKTSLLIERLLHQVLETDLRLWRVAAITFTEKAAGEMRDRLAKGLSELAEGPPKNEEAEAFRAWQRLREKLEESEIRSRASRALEELPTATISTIHGFCARVLRQHGHAIGVPHDFRVDQGFGYLDLRTEQWQAFLEGPDGPEGIHRDAWAGVLDRFDLGELRRIAFALCDFGLKHLPEEATLPDPRRILGEWIEERIVRVERAIGTGIDTKDGLGSYLVAAREVLAAFRTDGPDGLRAAAETERYLTKKRARRSVLDDAVAPKAKAFPGAETTAKEVRSDLRDLAQLDDAALDGALQRLLPFALAARASAVREGVLPFDALLVLTRDLLATRPDLRRTIGRRFGVMLVDEFQDTDPLQYEIVFFLAEEPEGEAETDPFRTRLAPGRLFIVGDPKQSIYGFRNADIVACQRAIRHVTGCGGHSLELRTTWRAPEVLVEPMNRLFEGVFRCDPEEDPGNQPEFTPASSGKHSGGETAGIEVWTLPSPEDGRKAEQARLDEAQAVASWIAGECGPDGSSRRGFGDVAILLRSSTEVHLYTRALRELGIPFQLDRSRNLLEQPEVKPFWSLLKAIARPTDGPALLGVLRSPIGCIEDAALARYASRDGESWCYSAATPDAERFPELARSFVWLRSLRERARTAPVDRLVAELLEESGLLPIVAAGPEGRARVGSLRALACTIANLARAEPAWPLARVLRLFESNLLRGEARARESAGTKESAVHVLTYHGAKGLEFPVVFLVDLGRSRQERGGRDSASPVGTTGAARDLWIATPQIRSSGALLDAQERERRDRAECRRLFYVACTRAEERLVLVHAPRASEKKDRWIDFLSPWGYEEAGAAGDTLPDEPHVRWRRDVVRRAEPVGTGPPTGRDWNEAIGRAEKAAATGEAHLRGPFRHPSGLREERDASEESRDEVTAPARAPDPSAGALARAVGLALHHILERWDFRDTASARAMVQRAASDAARSAGADPASVTAETSEVVEQLLSGELPGYLAGVEVIAREAPFLVEIEGERWSGTIDLVYRDRDGRLVVADYKTDRSPPAEAPEPYREQLRIYVLAVSRLFPDEPEPAREILYVRDGSRRRLEPPVG
jgi:ATP-dependent helicase/nuclease subunit A